MNIILLGMKHCGKSTVGMRLAKELDASFFDLDDMILAGDEGNGDDRSIEDLFRQKGADEFYHLEAEAYEGICRSPRAEHGMVLATGGRTPFNPRLQRVLEQCGVLIYINAPVDIIVQRIMEKGTSNLLSSGDPVQSLKVLYNERHPVYLQRAQLVVDGDGDIPTVVSRIRIKLEEYQRGGKQLRNTF